MDEKTIKKCWNCDEPFPMLESETTCSECIISLEETYKYVLKKVNSPNLVKKIVEYANTLLEKEEVNKND